MRVNLNILFGYTLDNNNKEFLDILKTLYKKDTVFQYVDFKDIIPLINTADDLITVLKSLEYSECLMQTDGIKRLLTVWEKLYFSYFTEQAKTHRLLVNEDVFQSTIDEVNELRKALRTHNEFYAVLCIKLFFRRLSVFTNIKSPLPKHNFKEIKNKSLELLVIALYN
jgi:hypothetical protein